VQVPLPIAEVWSELQTQVEELTGQAGLQILRAILENEVTGRVGPPHRPHPSAGCVRWGSRRVMWFLRDRKFRCNGRAYEPAQARKWNCRATVSCGKTGNCKERCGNAWWPGCPRGIIGERCRVLWKATGSKRAV
jgi:hypothetical protein